MKPPRFNQRRFRGGFTLIEILIALAILAIALAAASRAAHLGIDTASEAKQRVLAGLALDNRVAVLRLTRTRPVDGVVRTEVSQAGERFVVTETTAPSANALIKQIDVEVASMASPSRVLGRATLYVASEGAIRAQ
jgi:general secretion pathway protein I